jgi:uncharacterized protein YeaO (DUF488 family)
MTRADRVGARGARRPIRLKRVYEQPGRGDGLRVLVDRLWPRGLTRHEVLTDLWLKDAAPSSPLRRWYGHEPRRWERFREKYRTELAQKWEVLHLLDDLRRRTAVTLLFGARDEAHSHAVVLREVLEERSLLRHSRPKS